MSYALNRSISVACLAGVLLAATNSTAGERFSLPHYACVGRFDNQGGVRNRIVHGLNSTRPFTTNNSFGGKQSIYCPLFLLRDLIGSPVSELSDADMRTTRSIQDTDVALVETDYDGTYAQSVGPDDSTRDDDFRFLDWDNTKAVFTGTDWFFRIRANSGAVFSYSWKEANANW